jgi:hypothetical protein
MDCFYFPLFLLLFGVYLLLFKRRVPSKKGEVIGQLLNKKIYLPSESKHPKGGLFQ